MKTNDFKKYLSNELVSRVKKNSNYSIRAFARDLGINDSTLSKLINGKMPLTKKRILHLSKRLKISNAKTLQFLKGLNEEKISKGDIEVELGVFNLMSEWYYDAIIELTKISNLDKAPRSISKYLGITVTQAKLALNQLKKLSIVIENDDGEIICNQENSLTQFYEISFTNDALKNYQSQILDLSKKALMSQPREKRNHTSHVIAVDSEIIEDVNNKIKKFQHDLAEYIEKNSKNKDKVYAMQFTNFEITKNKEMGI